MILNFARGNWLLFLDFLQVHTEVVPEAGNPATSLLKLTHFISAQADSRQPTCRLSSYSVCSAQPWLL